MKRYLLILLLLISFPTNVSAEDKSAKDIFNESFKYYENNSGYNIDIIHDELDGWFSTDYQLINQRLRILLDDMNDARHSFKKPIVYVGWKNNPELKNYTVNSVIYIEEDELNRINPTNDNMYEIDFFNISTAYIVNEEVIKDEDITKEDTLDKIDIELANYINNELFGQTLDEINYNLVMSGKEQIEYDSISEEKAYEIFEEDLIKFEMEETEYGNNIVLSFKAGLSLTDGMTRSSIKKEMTKYLKSIQNEEFDSIQITALAEFTDVYGNTFDDTAAYLLIYKDTVDKINFDNFDYDNLDVIADSFYFNF